MKESESETPQELHMSGDEFLSSEKEIATNPEKRKNVTIGVVLGSGFVLDKEGHPIKLNLDAKVRTLAAGMIAQERMVSELIFTGGKIAGPEYPAISEAMVE
ncbi:MAG: hypothetical protein WC451_03790 [Patescibacteria group bacterium]|jgi:hypothetical protein